MTTKSQNQAILNHLKNHGPITPLEALNLYGCFRLGGRIYDLKNMGHAIETEMVSENGKRFARYHLIAESSAA